MRTRNSLLNIVAGVGGQTLTLIFSFIGRTVFVYTLSSEYLGVNGLFGDILSLLSIVEFGIGSAITYSMYAPIAEKNNEKIFLLMQLYKKIYNFLGVVVATIGISIVPFIYKVVNDATGVEHLKLIYLLYLLNTISSYFFAYKRTIIEAHQKKYICSTLHYAFLIFQHIVQIVVLFITHNFVLYLTVQIVCTYITNITISILADKMYPYLKNKSKVLTTLDPNTHKEIIKNTKAMFAHRMGTILVNNTDTIIISTFVNIVTVGIYSNYKLLLNALEGIIKQIFEAFTASIGNLGASNNKKRVKEIYEEINFLGFWIYGFTSLELYFLINPFIKLWIGEKFLFPKSTIVCIVTIFYLTGMRQTTLRFRDALGLFWYDRYKPLFESVINLVASLILVNFYGINGVLLGTIISIVTTVFWIEPYVLYKYGFQEPLSEFFTIYIKRTSILMVTFVIQQVFLNYISQVMPNNIFGLLAIGCLICVFTNFMWWIIYRKSSVFLELTKVVLRGKGDM